MQALAVSGSTTRRASGDTPSRFFLGFQGELCSGIFEALDIREGGLERGGKERAGLYRKLLFAEGLIRSLQEESALCKVPA